MGVCVNKREVGVVGAVDQYMAVVKGSFRPIVLKKSTRPEYPCIER
jgi:hypothetical protein